MGRIFGLITQLIIGHTCAGSRGCAPGLTRINPLKLLGNAEKTKVNGDARKKYFLMEKNVYECKADKGSLIGGSWPDLK